MINCKNKIRCILERWLVKNIKKYLDKHVSKCFRCVYRVVSYIELKLRTK